MLIKEPWPSNRCWISKLDSILGAPWDLCCPLELRHKYQSVARRIQDCQVHGARIQEVSQNSRQQALLCTHTHHQLSHLPSPCLCLAALNEPVAALCLPHTSQAAWMDQWFHWKANCKWSKLAWVAKCEKQWDISNSNTWTTKNCHRIRMQLRPTWKN